MKTKKKEKYTYFCFLISQYSRKGAKKQAGNGWETVKTF